MVESSLIGDSPDVDFSSDVFGAAVGTLDVGDLGFWHSGASAGLRHRALGLGQQRPLRRVIHYRRYQASFCSWRVDNLLSRRA